MVWNRVHLHGHPVTSNNNDLQCKTLKAEARRWLIIGPNAVLVLEIPCLCLSRLKLLHLQINARMKKLKAIKL